MPPEDDQAEGNDVDLNDDLDSDAEDNQDDNLEGLDADDTADSGDDTLEDAETNRDKRTRRSRERLQREREDALIGQARAEGRADALEKSGGKEVQEDEVQKLVSERKRVANLVKSGELEDNLEVREYLGELDRKQTKLEVLRDTRTSNAEERRASTAQAGIKEYFSEIPALLDNTSKEFQRYSDEYNFQVDELGLPASSATQLVAAKATFGDLKRIKSRKNAKDFDRENRATHVETNGSGGRPSSGGNSWKKGIKKAQFDHWKELGYTDEQMKKKAKYVPASMRM